MEERDVFISHLIRRLRSGSSGRYAPINWAEVSRAPDDLRERVASDSARLNELHANKNSTPTMGGLFIVAAVVIAILLWGDPTSRYAQLGLVVSIGFAALGAVDDWIKLSTRKKGLTVRQKLAVQIVLSLVCCTILYFEQRDKPHGLERCR